MKRILIFLVLTVLTNFAFGQTEKVLYKTVIDSFELNYNRDNFDAIFLSFSPEMQNALPLDKTKEFLTELKQQAGKITKREFLKYEQTYASYKTNFERSLFVVNISVDNNSKINGLFVKPFNESNLPKLDRNITKLILPFIDEWTVIWGGDTKELNYHVVSEAQKNAFDLVITNDKGTSFKTDGKTNDDYLAFGKELIAPCDSIFAHFKQHSIVVKEGLKVKQGQLLGLCGNSGNSSEPHLHFHIQNIEDMNYATGVKCYFDKILVNEQIKTDYSPIQKEKIQNKK